MDLPNYSLFGQDLAQGQFLSWVSLLEFWVFLLQDLSVLLAMAAEYANCTTTEK